MNGKKKLAEKREHAQFRLMSSSCVTSLSFSVFFFLSVSLPLSRFNKASCRAWPSWERQQSVAGAEAELGWVAAAGVQVRGARGGRVGGSDFRPFSPCNTARSLASWQAAGCSLPFVFFPFTPLLTSFPSYFSCSPPLHPSPAPTPSS